ncbi:HET-domain-containing protein [Microthyrium microscopicum]|uniref:HET-domain-containing protein n=1 Tax=Microthyrium microscopicum TaxID=703497 RepID=A0A6A6U450_9PEZI|nr:HET-domain-containing protein [Microthyrium microscopicum]
MYHDVCSLQTMDSLEISDIEISRKPSAKFDLDTVDFEAINTWLYACKHHNHPRLDSLGPGLLENMQFFLVDVQEQCVIETSPTVHYAALSYVWGGVSQLSLTTANVDTLRIPGVLDTEQSNIPASIKDAMQVCLRTNTRYMWVDSLCIPQNSPLKAQYIKNMHLVYSCADFTIVAADGLDASHGIAGVSRPRQNVHFEFSSEGLDLTTTIRSPVRQLDSSKWYSRAWTYQEAAFSQRLLVFTNYMCYLLCPSMNQREDGKQDITKNGRSSNPCDVTSFLLRFSDWNSGPKDKMIEIAMLLTNYLGRQLSDQDDILNAFSGTMTAFYPVVGHFWYGIPVSYLAVGLSWMYAIDQDKKQTDSKAQVGRRKGFPSWSCTGWFHPDRSTLMFTLNKSKAYEQEAYVQLLRRTPRDERVEVLNSIALVETQHHAYLSSKKHFSELIRELENAIDATQLLGLWTRSVRLRVNQTPLCCFNGLGSYELCADDRARYNIHNSSQIHIEKRWRDTAGESVNFILLGAIEADVRIEDHSTVSLVAVTMIGPVAYRVGIAAVYLQASVPFRSQKLYRESEQRLVPNPQSTFNKQATATAITG